jgi:single-strand DNA-binding protein
MINKLMLIGHLGSDAKETSGGFAKLSVATTESYKTKDGEVKKSTQWHSIVIFNPNLVKFAIQHLKKGMKVFVEGKISYRTYEDEQGNKKNSVDIIIGKSNGEIKILSNKE